MMNIGEGAAHHHFTTAANCWGQADDGPSDTPAGEHMVSGDRAPCCQQSPRIANNLLRTGAGVAAFSSISDEHNFPANRGIGSRRQFSFHWLSLRTLRNISVETVAGHGRPMARSLSSDIPLRLCDHGRQVLRSRRDEISPVHMRRCQLAQLLVDGRPSKLKRLLTRLQLTNNRLF